MRNCLVGVRMLYVFRFIKLGSEFKISAIRVWANNGHDFDPERASLGVVPEIMHIVSRVDVLPYRCATAAIRTSPMKRILHD